MPVSAPDRRIGVGQEWQNVTGSRALTTTYTNTTGRPISVVVQMTTTTSTGTPAITVGGVALPGEFHETGVAGFLRKIEAIVPIGKTYVVTTPTGWTLTNWLELR